MDGHDIALESLHFICLAALSLAAKFDCNDSKVPKFSRLAQLLDVPESCKPAQFRQLEGMMMGHFKWNIFIPTATHYIELLREQILHPTDLLAGEPVYDYFQQIDDRLAAFITYFLDIALQVFAFFFQFQWNFSRMRSWSTQSLFRERWAALTIEFSHFCAHVA